MKWSLPDIFQNHHLRRRILFTLGALAIYRVGAAIPIPGINPEALKSLFEVQGWGFFDIFSGGALGRFSIFSLGIMPYMNAAMIIYILQIIGLLHRPNNLHEENGPSWRKWTLLLTLLFAVFQAFGLTHAIARMPAPGYFSAVINPGIFFYLVAAGTLTAGTVFLAWLAQQITEKGIGNGISLIILFGVVDHVPKAVITLVGELVNRDQIGRPELLFVIILVIIVLTVSMETARRKIPILFAQRTIGGRIYRAASGSFSLNVSQSGVAAIRWAVGISVIPFTLVQFNPQSGWARKVLEHCSSGSWTYQIIYAGLIILFCYLFAAISINPKALAQKLKSSGGTIPGIEPGNPTTRHLECVLDRLLIWGALFVVLIAVLPDFLRHVFTMPFFFGGTALLITVGVALDIANHFEAHIAMSGQGGKVVFTGFNIAEANFAKELLGAHKLKAFMLDENICRLNPLAILAVGGVRVLVPNDQAEEAREVLRERLGSAPLLENNEQEIPGKTQKKCPGCGASCDVDAGFCSQCGRHL